VRVWFAFLVPQVRTLRSENRRRTPSHFNDELLPAVPKQRPMLIRQNFDLHILESTEHLTILHHGDLNCSKGGRCEVGKKSAIAVERTSQQTKIATTTAASKYHPGNSNPPRNYFATHNEYYTNITTMNLRP
jgi:hypothetical protein